MTEAYVCDRCGKICKFYDHERITIRWFHAFDRHLDLCRSCRMDYERMYDDWWRQRP